MAFGEDDVLSLPFRYVVWIVAGLPLTALVLCLSLSVLLHLNESTATHCHVDNWLPSVSAAVSSFSPERYIWRVLIGIHGGPRLVLAIAFRNYIKYSPLRPLSGSTIYAFLCNLGCGLNLAENIFLLMLTSISSVENHEIHKACFIGFCITAIMYMVLSTWLFHYSGRRRSSPLGEMSYEYKILSCAVSLLALVIGAYLFYRHNTYCEPGVYTLFALSEYCIVVANIFFHSTLYYDFHGKRFTISSVGTYSDYQILPLHAVDKDT